MFIVGYEMSRFSDVRVYTTPNMQSDEPQKTKRGDACDALVQEIMDDPKRNHPLIPDSIEAPIYKFALQGSTMALQAGLGWVVARLVMRNGWKTVLSIFRLWKP